MGSLLHCLLESLFSHLVGSLLLRAVTALRPTGVVVKVSGAAGTFAGLAYGIAALLQVARTGVGDPQAGQTSNLDSITAVVLGGTSLFGGRGSIVGTLIGALIVGVFTLGLRLLGADAQWTYLLIGALIIAAVAVDQWIRKVSV